ERPGRHFPGAGPHRHQERPVVLRGVHGDRGNRAVDLAGHCGDHPSGRRSAPRPARLGAPEPQGGGREAGLRCGRRDRGSRALDERRHPRGDPPPGRHFPGAGREHPWTLQRRERPAFLRRRRRRARARAVGPSGRGGEPLKPDERRLSVSDRENRQEDAMRNFRSWRTLWVVVLLFFPALLPRRPGRAQPHRITDFNRGRTRSFSTPFPEAGTERDGVLYLPARDLQHGYELWRTDGTTAGTSRLTDLCPGLCDGASGTLGLFQGRLYFVGNDSEHGSEIWRTDGTVGGEELVADVCPGSCSPLLDGWTVWRGQIWFLAQKTYDAIPVLWTSDGTRAGTRPVASLCRKLSICDFGPYTSASLAGPDPSGQGLVVRVFESYDTKSLYRTDGTAGGTVLLHRFADQGSGYGEAATVPLYFLDGSDLWTSDGTPSGTHLVRSLSGLVDFTPLRSSTRVIDGILYIAFDGGEWLRSDGTAEGTVVLANVGIGSNPTVERIGSSVFAVAAEGIWRTGGSPETTSRIEWPFGLSHGPGGFGAAVWTTDGTLAGTRKIHFDGGPEPDSYVLAAFGNGALISRGARELWRIDGTRSRGERLHEFEPENGGSGPTDQIVLGGRLLFTALANPTSRKLFSSDGTAAGTSEILAISRNPYAEQGATYDPAYSSLTRAGTRAFFNARGRVWSSDGTREGTRIWQPNPSYAGFGMIAPIGSFGDRFVFSGILDLDEFPTRCPSGESEPWVSDGAHVMKRLLNLNPYHYEAYGICLNVNLSSAPGRGVPLGR